METTARFAPAAANAFMFLLIPAAVALAIAYYVSQYPPAFAHPSQAAALQLSLLAPIVFLGAAGVFLSIASGMTPNPLSGESGLSSALWSGLLLGTVVYAADHVSGFSQVLADQLKIKSIHIAFPASLYVYTAGAIAVECLYRFIPIAFLYALIAQVALGGRGERFVFWSLAILSSMIEPLSQAPLAGREPSLMWALFGLIFVFNMSEVALWRRYGWIAPLVARLVFYGVWHVALGPLVSGTLTG